MALSAASANAHRRPGRATRLGLVACAAATGGAEILSASVSVTLGALLDAAILLVAITMSVVRAPVDASRLRDTISERVESAAWLSLSLVPLLRLASTIQPVQHLDERSWLAVAGVPVLIGALLAARVVGVVRNPWSERSRAGHRVEAVLALAVGAAAGLGLYLVGPSHTLAGRSALADLGVAASAALFVGWTEELVFRGLVQRSLGGLLGGRAVLVTAALYAAMQAGSRSGPVIALMGVVGLVFGVWARRSGNIGGVALAHAALAVGALAVWPRVLGGRYAGALSDPRQAATVVAAAAAAGLLLHGLGRRYPSWAVGPDREPFPAHARRESGVPLLVSLAALAGTVLAVALVWAAGSARFAGAGLGARVSWGASWPGLVALLAGVTLPVTAVIARVLLGRGGAGLVVLAGAGAGLVIAGAGMLARSQPLAAAGAFLFLAGMAGGPLAGHRRPRTEAHAAGAGRSGEAPAHAALQDQRIG